MRTEKVGKQASRQKRKCFSCYLATTLDTVIWNKSHNAENTMFTEKMHYLWVFFSERLKEIYEEITRDLFRKAIFKRSKKQLVDYVK